MQVVIARPTYRDTLGPMLRRNEQLQRTGTHRWSVYLFSTAGDAEDAGDILNPTRGNVTKIVMTDHRGGVGISPASLASPALNGMAVPPALHPRWNGNRLINDPFNDMVNFIRPRTDRFYAAIPHLKHCGIRDALQRELLCRPKYGNL